jgi:hypothetical protein
MSATKEVLKKVDDALKVGKKAVTATAKAPSAPAKVVPKARRVIASPLDTVRGTTPAVQAQNRSVEKLLPKDQVERIANALQQQVEANRMGKVIPMSDLGVTGKDILAFQTATQMVNATPSAKKSFGSFFDQLEQSGMQTNSTMPLGNAEELRKAIGMEAGHGMTDTSAPLQYMKDGQLVRVPTGVGYFPEHGGWANDKGARPTHDLSSVILQGTETRPIQMVQREDGAFVPSNLRDLQIENQIDAPVGSIDTRGLDFPIFGSDSNFGLVSKALSPAQQQEMVKALIARSSNSMWDKTAQIEKATRTGQPLPVDKGIPKDQLEMFREAMRKGGLGVLNEMFGVNRKFRKMYADTMSSKETTQKFGVPHYTSYGNAMLADPVKRTQLGGTTQLILRPTSEGMDVANLSPDFQYEYPWHTPTDLISNLYGENVPRSLMYETGIRDVMATHKNRQGKPLTGSQSANKILKSKDTPDQRVLLEKDVESAIRFSQLWKKATSGQGLSQEEADELIRLDRIRRFQY